MTSRLGCITAGWSCAAAGTAAAKPSAVDQQGSYPHHDVPAPFALLQSCGTAAHDSLKSMLRDRVDFAADA